MRKNKTSRKRKKAEGLYVPVPDDYGQYFGSDSELENAEEQQEQVVWKDRRHKYLSKIDTKTRRKEQARKDRLQKKVDLEAMAAENKQLKAKVTRMEQGERTYQLGKKFTAAFIPNHKIFFMCSMRTFMMSRGVHDLILARHEREQELVTKVQDGENNKTDTRDYLRFWNGKDYERFEQLARRLWRKEKKELLKMSEDGHFSDKKLWMSHVPPHTDLRKVSKNAEVSSRDD